MTVRWHGLRAVESRWRGFEQQGKIWFGVGGLPPCCTPSLFFFFCFHLGGGWSNIGLFLICLLNI